MDKVGGLYTDGLTHILIEQAGWIPVDDGRYVVEDERTASIRFTSDGKTIIARADRVIALKYVNYKVGAK